MENNGVGYTMFKLIKELAKGRDIKLAEEFTRKVNNDDEGHTSYKGFQVADTKIVAIHMDNATKRKLVESTAAAIEYGRMDVLESNDCEYGRTQAMEISTFVRQATRNSLDVTYNAEEGAHDDTISALVLAFRGVPPRQRIIFAPEKDLTKKAKSLFRGGGKSFRHAQRT